MGIAAEENILLGRSGNDSRGRHPLVLFRAIAAKIFLTTFPTFESERSFLKISGDHCRDHFHIAFSDLNHNAYESCYHNFGTFWGRPDRHLSTVPGFHLSC